MPTTLHAWQFNMCLCAPLNLYTQVPFFSLIPCLCSIAEAPEKTVPATTGRKRSRLDEESSEDGDEDGSGDSITMIVA